MKLLTFNEFLNEDNLIESITYEDYCLYLDAQINEGLISDIKDKSLQLIAKTLGPIKSSLDKISREFGVGLSQIIEAFKQKSIFEFLKAIKFNLKLILKAFNELSDLVRSGLFKIFESISKTGAFENLRKGTLKLDEFLEKYPILKKVGGLAVAAILMYMWLNMSFIGNLDYDFNWSDIIDALRGKFSITDLFMSPSGMMLISLFATGPYLSVPWLGSSIYNLTLALFYTGYVKLKDAKSDIKNLIKRKTK